MPADFASAIIPRTFRLGGLTINVRLDDTLLREKQLIGLCRFREQEILLDPGAGNLAFAEHLYLCQLVDWIFFLMGEHELRANRRLVEGFAHLLYQALITAKPLAAAEDQGEGGYDDDWDEFEDVDYDPGCNDDYDLNADELELLRMEQEEEEKSLREQASERSCWSDYADSWARSEDEGWFYDDED